MNQVFDAEHAMKEWLSARKRNIHHRQLVWVCGQQQWTSKFAEQLLQLTGLNDNLWVGEPVANPNHISHDEVRGVLGTEHSNVVYECYHQFSLNTLLALVGTVKANGLVLLLSPTLDEWSNQCRCITSQSYGFTAKRSQFIDYLCEYLINDTNVIKVFQNKPALNHQQKPLALPQLEANRLAENKPTPNPEQAHIINRITKRLKSPYIATVIAKRGRGKSWLLGWLAKALIEKRCRVVLIAPQAKSTNQVFKHLDDQQSNQLFRYCAPDDNALVKDTFDFVIVDEAAAIPIPLLQRIVDNQKHCVFSTTVGGYEGSASGFLHRFVESIKSSTDHDFEQFSLLQPMRWYRGDHLEQTVDGIFKSQEQQHDANVKLVDTPQPHLQFDRISKQQLLNEPKLALQIYALLATAHYQTTPNDFVRLFDAEDTIIFGLSDNKHIVAAALCIIEGGDRLADLRKLIATGERRVRGHLTPQHLSYNTTHSSFCLFNYLRINRIAVTPCNQNRGLGSLLTNKICEFARRSSFDIVSTSFGAKPQLMSFWEKNAFIQYQIGKKLDKASGMKSAIYLRPLNRISESAVANNIVLTEEQHRQKLIDFTKGTRNIASIREALSFHSNRLNNQMGDDSCLSLLGFVANSPEISEGKIIERFKLQGKKQLTAKLKEAIQLALVI